MGLNLGQLRALISVAQQGTVTSAARSLGVSQPALSKQLAELEEELQLRLFDRRPRGMRLTEAGEHLNRRAVRIFAEMEAAESELGELQGLRRGKLRIGASTTIGNYLLPGLFGRFSESYPAIALELMIANTQQIQAAVLGGEMDFGLSEGFVSSDSLHVIVVAHDEIIAIGSPRHALADKLPLYPEDISATGVILREEGSGTRAVIEAEFAKLGVELRSSMTLGSSEAIKNAVAAGLGVAFVSKLTVQTDIASGRIHELPVTGLRILRALHLLQLKGKHASPAADAFVKLLLRGVPDARRRAAP